MKRTLPLWIVLALATALGACTGTTDIAKEGDAGPHSGDCAVCHLGEFNAVKHPLHPGKKPTTCAVCHLASAWSPKILNHGWPLEGAHEKADCFFCHHASPPVFEGTSRVCVDCHRPDFDKENAKSPGHEKNGTTCGECHSATAWKPAHRPSTPAAVVRALPSAEPPTVTPPAAVTSTPTVLPSPKPTVAKPTPKPKPTNAPWPDTTTGASRRH